MASPSRILLIVGFLDFTSIFLVLPYLDLHAKELGFNHIQIGLIGAVFSGCQMISSPIVGSLSDVKDRKPMLLLCLIICSLAYFWLGITSSLFVFFALRVVLGTFQQAHILMTALAPEHIDDPTQVSVLFGKLASLGAIGMSVGSIFSGYVMEAYPENGFSIMCAIVSTLFLLNTGLINSLPDSSNKKKEKSEAVLQAPKLFDSIVDVLKQTVNKFYGIDWAKFWDIFTYNFLMSVSVGLYYSNIRLFLTSKLDMSPVYLGYIMAFQGLISAVINNSIAFINKLYVNDKDYSQRIFHIFLIIALSLTGLAVMPSIPMYIALLLPKAAAFDLARIVTLEVVTNRSVSDNRGTVIGAFNSVGSVAGIVTPIVGGFINHYLGVTSSFFAGAMFASIGLVINYRASSRFIEEKNK